MSNSNTGISVPPGQYPPFAVVTDTDHTAWVIISTALGLAYTLLFGAIRIFSRYTTTRNFGLDDFLLAAATGFTIIQSSLVLVACSDGLGKSIELVSSENEVRIAKLSYVSTLIFVLVIGLSKTSVIFLLLRLTAKRYHKLLFSSAVGFISLWVFASFLALAFQCNLRHPWLVLNQHCPGVLLRWQIISVFDILSEIGIVGLAIHLVWDLNTKMSTKVMVVSAFAFRLGALIPISFRLATFDQIGYTTNPTLLNASYIVWTQTELCYSIISATVPSLRTFAQSLNTGFGGMGPTMHDYGYGYDENSTNLELSVIRSGKKSKGKANTLASQTSEVVSGPSDSYKDGLWIPSTGVFVSNVQAVTEDKTINRNKSKDGQAKDSISVESNDSRRMIIKKDITWKVEYTE